jgi:hypothetical protein
MTANPANPTHFFWKSKSTLLAAASGRLEYKMNSSFSEGTQPMKQPPNIVRSERAAMRFFVAMVTFVLLLAKAKPSHAYSAWLSCDVGLDESEVIMNYIVVAAEKARHPVEIEVQRVTEGEPETPEQWATTDLTFPSGSTTKWRARLRVPEALSYRTVQYAIESSSDAALFVPSVTCQGRRSHSPRADAAVSFEIDGTTAGSTVELWAGYATGHEAVSLTPRIVFRRTEASAPDL